MLINNELIHVIEYPVDNAKASIIFTHGIAEHQLHYVNMIQTFNKAGYNVITYDVRGHGRSGGRRGYIKKVEMFADDLGFLVKYVKTKYQNKIYLMGHSMGALITNLYIISNQNDVSGVIVTGASATFNKAITFLRIIPSSLIWYVNIKTNFFDPNLQNKIPREEDIINDHFNLRAFNIRLVSQTLVRGMKKIRRSIHKITIPYLILHGELDILATPESSRYLYQKISSEDKKYILYSNMYHNLLNDIDNDQILLDIINWLDVRQEEKNNI